MCFRKRKAVLLMSDEIPTSTLDEFFHLTNNEKIKVAYVGYTKEGDLYCVDEYGDIEKVVPRAKIVNTYICNSNEASSENLSLEIKDLVVQRTFLVWLVIKMNNLEYKRKSCSKIKIPFSTFIVLTSLNIDTKIFKITK